MRLHALLIPGLLLGACSQRGAEERAFIHTDEVSSQGDPGHLFLDDALTRLTADERRRYERLGKTTGFLFSGTKFTCIVIVTLRTDVINDAGNPAFCYVKGTNKFVERL